MVTRFLKTAISGLFLTVTAIFLIGCDKDDMTEPATVNCSVTTLSASAMEGQISIDRIDLNLSEIDISGRRTNGEDMFFTRTFNLQSGNFPLLDEVTPTTVFQIPQGAYESLVFYTTLREQDYEFEFGSGEDENDETGDLAEYIQNAKAGLLIVGRYTNGEVEFPVVVALNDDLRRFAIEASQQSSPSVVLRRNSPSVGTLTVDPDYLFKFITSAMLENAIRFPLGDEQAVMISEDYNESIYNQLAGRMQGAVALTIEDQ